MDYSAEGLALTKQFEGLSLTAYRDIAGIWTIGYGHVLHAGEDFGPITEGRAEELLKQDLIDAIRYVNDIVKVPLTQGQFDALVDFTFNLGVGTLKSSTLLDKLNHGNYAAVPAELLKWDHSGGKVINGLLRRRQAELALWSKN